MDYTKLILMNGSLEPLKLVHNSTKSLHRLCLHRGVVMLNKRQPQKLIHMSMNVKRIFINLVSVNFHSFSILFQSVEWRGVKCAFAESVLFACTFVCRRHSLFRHDIRDAKYFFILSNLTLHRNVWQIVERRQQTISMLWKSMNGTNWFIDSDTQQPRNRNRNAKKNSSGEKRRVRKTGEKNEVERFFFFFVVGWHIENSATCYWLTPTRASTRREIGRVVETENRCQCQLS